MDRPTMATLRALSPTARQELAARWMTDDIIAAYGGALRYAARDGIRFWRTDQSWPEVFTNGPDIDAEIVRRVNPLRDEYRAATGRAMHWNVKAHNAVQAMIRDDSRVFHKGGRREIEAYFDIAKRAAQ